MIGSVHILTPFPFTSGPLVREVLLSIGLPDPYAHHQTALSSLVPSESAIRSDAASWAHDLHVHFISVQGCSESDRPEGELYGSSVSFATAMHPNQLSLLAHRANDAPLNAAHGFPLRALVPGHAGARSVKWLCALSVRTAPNDSPPMRLDYKMLTPPGIQKGQDEAEVLSREDQDHESWLHRISGQDMDEEFRKAVMVQEPPLQRLEISTAIAQPRPDEVITVDSDGTATLHANGYAVGQDGK